MPAKQNKTSSFSKCMRKTCYSGIYFSGRPEVCKKRRYPKNLREGEQLNSAEAINIASPEIEEASFLEEDGYDIDVADLYLDEDDEGFDY